MAHEKLNQHINVLVSKRAQELFYATCDREEIPHQIMLRRMITAYLEGRLAIAPRRRSTPSHTGGLTDIRIPCRISPTDRKTFYGKCESDDIKPTQQIRRMIDAYIDGRLAIRPRSPKI